MGKGAFVTCRLSHQMKAGKNVMAKRLVNLFGITWALTRDQVDLLKFCEASLSDL